VRRLIAPRNLAAAAFALGLLGLGIALAGSTLRVVWWLWSSVPVADQWATMADILRVLDGSYQWGNLLAQHNEHRILLPRLVFYLDGLLLKAEGKSLLALAIAIQLAHVLLLWRLAVRAIAPTRAQSIALLGVLLGCGFSAQQLENFTWGFQIQFVGVLLLMTMALAALARGAEQEWRSGRPWLLAIISSLAATFTMAGGILVWPILVASALRLGLKWRGVVATAVIGLAAIMFYLWGYRSPPQESDPLAAATQAQRVFAYLTVYLGHPAKQWGVEAAGVLGAVGLVGAIILSLRLAVERRWAPPAEVALAGTMLVGLGTGVLTALGRLHAPLTQALSDRYGTPATIFWLALILVAWSAARRMGRPALVVGAQGAGIALLLAIGLQQRAMVSTYVGFGEKRQIGAMALVTGVADAPSIAELHPLPRIPLRFAPHLRDRGLSLFAGEYPHDLMGRKLNDRLAVTEPAACRGAFELAQRVDGAPGLRVAGWAAEAKGRRAITWIVIADREGLIVGLAHGGMRERHLGVLPGAPVGDAYWVGFVSGDPWPVTAYALVGGTVACPLGARDVVRTDAGPAPIPVERSAAPPGDLPPPEGFIDYVARQDGMLIVHAWAMFRGDPGTRAIEFYGDLPAAAVEARSTSRPDLEMAFADMRMRYAGFEMRLVFHGAPAPDPSSVKLCLISRDSAGRFMLPGAPGSAVGCAR
jgi:multisubunit Na+/H+ antiporter MnhG subunit